MMLAHPSAPLTYDVDYSMNNNDSNNITNGWCAQEIFINFLNSLTNLKAQTPVHILKQQYETLFASIFVNSTSSEMNNLFYKLIAYTRDIKGLGSYNHAYMLVVELFKFGYKYEGQVNKEAIQNNAYLLVENFAKKYGSWKDIKYFLNYYVEDVYKDKQADISKDNFINKIIKLVCKQLREDSNSLIAKWLPREKSKKFGWLTPLFAREYYCEWFSENMSAGQYKAATRKALTHFRQLISKLNKQLETTQTYQCTNNWSQIDFNKNVTKNVTKNTMNKQKKTFNCVNKCLNSSNVYSMEQSIKTWDMILKELTNIRYNDLGNLKD